MKIISSFSDIHVHQLQDIEPGVAVRFQNQFHQDMERSDVFIVNQVPNDYWPFNTPRALHAVTNLRSGKLSYVAGDREVKIADCYVRFDPRGGS